MAINTEVVNIYKNTSVPRSNKGCLMSLHALEPIGLDIIANTSASILISGDGITGNASLYIHDTSNVRYIQQVNVGTETSVNISTLGGIFFYVDGIGYSVNPNSKFKFTITLKLDSSSYVVDPIFDMRNEKISNNVISDKNIFKQKVLATSNAELGMLMISENVRIYMPKSKYIPSTFDAVDVLNLIEDIYRIYNKLNGLDNNLNSITPREQFLLASARYEHVGYGSAGSTMMDTGVEDASFYMGPGWGLFHECGHMFEGGWSAVEIWTNMYSKFMQDRTSTFTWLWDNDRAGFENTVIKPYYDNYLAKGIFSEFGLSYKDGLYFFVSLEQALGANLIPKTELYTKLNSIPVGGFKFLVYSVAKNFGLNALAYGEIYGIYIYETSVINDIIDSSNATLLYVPENSNFNIYRNISAPVTSKLFYSEDQTIQGMSNPNAKITINVKNNNYQVDTDKNSKFSFKIPIPITLQDPVNIYSTEKGKVKSPTKTIYMVNHLADSIITFSGLANYEIASIGFNVNLNKLIVKSTGSQAHSYFGTQEYFGVQVKDANDNIKADIGVQGVQNADVFRDTLNNLSFNYDDVIVIRAQEENRISVTNYNGQQIKYNPQNSPEGFRIKNIGICQEFDYSSNEIVFKGLGNYEIARIKININKKVLQVTSTGTQAHYYFGTQEYFAVEILDQNNVSKIKAGVKGTENANAFRDLLNNQSLQNNYSIILSYKESGRVIITNYNSIDSFNPSGSSHTVKFNSTSNTLI